MRLGRGREGYFPVSISLATILTFAAGTQVVVGVGTEEGDDGSSTAMAGRKAAGGMATATGVRYRTMPTEQLVARGGGEMGDGGGHYILARDQHDPDGPLVRCRVARTYRRTAYHLQVLGVRDGDGREQTLRVTDEHPFYVAGRGWAKARDLLRGDVLLGAAGEASIVTANLGKAHPEGVTVYNLSVGHTYCWRAGAPMAAYANPRPFNQKIRSFAHG